MDKQDDKLANLQNDWSDNWTNSRWNREANRNTERNEGSNEEEICSQPLLYIPPWKIAKT